MSSQWHLLTGENEYEISRERARWVSNFAEKFGSENIVYLESEDLPKSALLDELTSAPFIAEKRLLVLDALPDVEKEDVPSIVEATHPALLVLCVDPKPDRRLGSTKAFLEHMEVRMFPQKNPQQLSAWVQNEATQRGIALAGEALSELLARTGPDQRLLSMEMTKLATRYGRGAVLSRADVVELVPPSSEQEVWQLMDYFAAGRDLAALGLVRDILNRGENPHGLWARVLWMVSQLVLVRAATDAGSQNAAAVSKSAGVPFPTARTLFPLARQDRSSGIRYVAEWFSSSDTALKSGGFKATGEAPEELNALLECGILKLCALAAKYG
ncbi:DNA polymerase III subunit delta [Candidatus Peregrinibacteria bacterium]|nr:DNA polymerase III subunit delta [Candidatus Peregrinibacteria bacterium]